MFGLSNPQRFMAFTGPLTPVLWGLAAVLLGVGAWLSFTVPADYQQGDTVRIMFVHVPAATLGLGAYAALGVSSFFALVFRHALADAAARAAALPGAAFTALALFTGSLWGQPMWGTWWVWDARLTSVLVDLIGRMKRLGPNVRLYLVTFAPDDPRHQQQVGRLQQAGVEVNYVAPQGA